jgi:hypothetical protein
MQEDSANLLHNNAKNPTHSASYLYKCKTVNFLYVADIQLEKRSEEILKSLVPSWGSPSKSNPDIDNDG